MTAELLPTVSCPVRHLPPRACDTHTHVFGPSEAFPRATAVAYDPPSASLDAHREAANILGFERGVLVQPGVYDQDCSALLDAVRRSNGALRGIGSAPATISDRALEDLVQSGVTGLRFVEVPDPRSGGRYAGSVGFETMELLAPRMRELGLAAEIWADLSSVSQQRALFDRLGLEVIVEHFARIDPSRGLEQPGFADLCALLAEGRFAIKVTVARIADPPSLRPFFDALVKANPERVVWGSDWPYVRMGDRAPDAGRLLDEFDVWINGDETLRHAIFVDNPESIFKFEGAE